MEGRTGANSTDTAEAILGIYVTRWHWRKYNWLGREALSVYVTRWLREGWRGKWEWKLIRTKTLWLMMIVTSEWNIWSARKWRAHAQLNHHWSWWGSETSQSPLRIHSNVLVQVKALVKAVVLGRTLLRALVFGALFWPHFGVPRQWFYPRERGCCRDQGWRCDFGSRFSWSFGCCISCCLGFFRALSWLQFRAWTRVGFLRGRLVVFFCCCFGWTFRCCLGRCFSLCFCVVGCLAPGLDPCMVVLVPVSQKFWLLFSTFDET